MGKMKYPNDERYEVHENGDIVGPKGTVLKAANNNSGYPFVAIGGVCKTVHRIVATTFIPNPENKRCVNHKDGNKLNNAVDNLEWCSHSENHRHAFRLGLKNHKGEGGPSHILTTPQVRIIKEALSLQHSTRDIANYFRVSYSAIAGIKQGKKWAHI